MQFYMVLFYSYSLILATYVKKDKFSIGIALSVAMHVLKDCRFPVNFFLKYKVTKHNNSQSDPITVTPLVIPFSDSQYRKCLHLNYFTFHFVF